MGLKDGAISGKPKPMRVYGFLGFNTKVSSGAYLVDIRADTCGILSLPSPPKTAIS